MRSLTFRLVPVALVMIGLVVSLPASADEAASAADVQARVAQLRTLLGSEQGAAMLDLLGDPRVRQAILRGADATPPSQARPGNAGEMMNTMLAGVRTRLEGLATELSRVPDELGQAWDRLQSQLPGPELLRLVGLLVVFLAGGIGAQWLFFRLTRPWRHHFGTLKLSTARERAVAVCERLSFATSLIAAFAAGSMGAFLLFSWPPLTGSIILGYLLAFLVVRLGLTSVRFFLAPGAERLRLLPVSTEAAWFLHRWVAVLAGATAVGWQTLLTLRALGVPQPGLDVLSQLLLLVLVGLGIWVVWMMPPSAQDPAQPNRGPVPRLLISLGLVLDWLLFLMGATASAWTLLILAAAPLAHFILGRSASAVMLGRCLQPGDERPAYVAIAERAIQALVVVATAAALVAVWDIDLTRMSNMDTPMMRIGRGLLEALVILVIADLLWQVVRVLIDARLAGDVASIDALDGDELRRQARLRTLLPVLRNFALFIVLVMASLSALAAMGLQIGPLLAGAGVVGIAVGFGAQTLVRDILSGVFFLLDDAFRVGEYIESGGIRGTVESFSLRSVKLRHLNGQLHTVPFGDLKAITNYSRDWVIENLHVTVTYDTNLELLDSLVDSVSDELMADPAIAPEMIEPLRSLGVQAMVDTGMQVGLMFKTRPGHQYAIRRVVFGRIRATFMAHGIRFATAVPLTVGSSVEPAATA